MALVFFSLPANAAYGQCDYYITCISFSNGSYNAVTRYCHDTHPTTTFFKELVEQISRMQ